MVDGYIFTGDAYIPGVKVITNLPQGDMKKAEISLNRIMSLVQNNSICPGHKLLIETS